MGTERVAARMLELSAGRVPYVHATVVRAQVPSSAHAGDEAIVMPDGSIDGFVGGVCAENSVRTAALGALNGGGPVLLRVLPEGGAGFPESPGARVVVNPCLSGGALEIFLDPKLPPPLIEIVGRTPVADGVVALAGVLGYETERSLPGGLSDRTDAVIVASHGRDEPASLRAALDAEVPYIALVASRRRGRAVLDDLRLSPEDRARISTPAGLDIGARTGPEVALSILAEVIESVRRGTGGVLGRPDVRAGGEPPGVRPAGAAADPPDARAGHRPDAGAADRPGDRPAAGAAGAAGARPGVRVTAPGGARAEGSPRTVADPVCGMAVVVMDDTPHLAVDGDDFWFCGDLCRERYAREGAG